MSGDESRKLRAKIGYVPQKASLFTGTVADNIRFGKETASDEEVEHAARWRKRGIHRRDEGWL